MIEEQQMFFYAGGGLVDTKFIPSSITLSCIPGGLYPNIDQLFHFGYRLVFAQLSLPVGGYSELELQCVACFLADDGKLEYALDCITHSLPIMLEFKRSMWATGAPGHMEEIAAEYAQHPKCANNEKIRLVRQKMGLTRDKQWGPYGEDRRLLRLVSQYRRRENRRRL
ncbi:hypothetical protein WOLCODRAFT_152335 [Wolfiporia cocos MD-104 SS10]|uniref:Uncharacterized protein n=1 Tax=Wolfiporia cocos (strain MD-104) TaxID=742152 RepID=A0A2H3JTT3_WOLCO|nr:hypothetical protein WOLCODRAFT_152335 [Wolfiporia cocos MD-104 SS10]